MSINGFLDEFHAPRNLEKNNPRLPRIGDTTEKASLLYGHRLTAYATKKSVLSEVMTILKLSKL